MTTEFNLSEKIHDISYFSERTPCIYSKDVKEFIRLLKMEIPNEYNNDKQEFHKRIDKLAGEKLC